MGEVYSVFLTLGFAVKNILTERQNREIQSFMRMQKQQYDYQLQQSTAVRLFKHDLANYIAVLRELMKQKKTEAEFDVKIHTGDSFLDIICF